MLKKRYFSTKDDFKTGFFCKLALLVGIIFLLVFVVIKIVAFIVGEGSSGTARQIYDFSQTTYLGTILAFSIILIGVGLILYFFYCQFVKLSKIAEEIENEDDIEQDIEKPNEE